MNIGLVMILLILGALLVWWLTRVEITCPQCGSRKVNQVSKQMLGFQNLEYGGLEHRSGIQANYEVKYRCGQCEAQWTTTVRETST